MLEVETASVKQCLKDITEAWNQGDTEAFADCFTPDADYITYFGQHVVGRKEIIEVHRALFGGFMKGSELMYQESHIRFLSADVALIYAIGTTKMRWQKKAPKSRVSINTNVAVKTGGGRKIAAFHNSRVKTNGLILRIVALFSSKQDSRRHVLRSSIHGLRV